MCTRVGIFLGFVFWAAFARSAELRVETLKAWNTYMRFTDARIESELESPEGFLVMDFLPASERAECEKRFLKGDVCVLKRRTVDDEGKSIPVPSGMIHHWFGAILVPGVSVERVVRFVQSYDRSAQYYDDVEDSRLLSRKGDVFEIFLRLKRKKVITVHYNTEHEVTYRERGEGRVSSWSVATRIREIANAGRPDESEKPVGQDRGFLWRLRSYWRFEQTDDGTVVECESVSLSRSIPAAARWLVKHYLDSVPKESLESTLTPIRRNLAK